MVEFFRNGGVGMYLVLVFGFPLVAASVLYALRPERSQWPLLTALALSTVVSGVLGFSLGLMMTFKYIQKVPQPEQFVISALGFSESITNLILAFMLLAMSGGLVSIGTFRGARGAATTTAAR
jgi:hypothetical protein